MAGIRSPSLFTSGKGTTVDPTDPVIRRALAGILTTEQQMVSAIKGSGKQRSVLFNSSGTFTTPAGIRAALVIVVGGGGGGGGGGSGGNHRQGIVELRKH